MEQSVGWRKHNVGASIKILHWKIDQRNDQQLSAGFTLRSGGYSTGAFQSLNCGMHVGDQVEAVIENRKHVAKVAGFTWDAWTIAEQVHSNHVEVVSLAEKGRGRDRLQDALPKADALITKEKGIMLTALFADCVPLYFYDPVQQAVGIAHAGWRGTAANIVGKTVEAMARSFGSEPTQLQTAIGPSIGSCCYEVDDTVVSQLEKLVDWEKYRELVTIERPETNAQQKKWMLDLKQLNRHLMIKAGIMPKHIELTNICTSCRTQDFFSHRQEKGKTGRMVGWIGLRD